MQQSPPATASSVGAPAAPKIRRSTDSPYHRRASDLVRLIVAILALVILGLRAGQVGAVQLNLYLAFSSLPQNLVPLIRQIEQLGTLWLVAACAIVALVTGRWRLMRDVVLAGALGWGVSKFLAAYVVDQSGVKASLKTLAHAGTTAGFPQVRLAVLAAVVVVAGPYVARPLRRLGQVLALVMGVGAVYIGTGYPDNLLAGACVGWAVACVTRLLFGAPGGHPSAQELAALLPKIGIDPNSIRLSKIKSPNGVLFDCDDNSGPLLVKLIGRDDLDAQLLARTWRAMAYKDPAPPLQLTRVQQVEHEACMALLAKAAGVHGSDVLFVGDAGPRAALLVLRPFSETLLADVPPEQVTDQLLTEIWQQLGRLHHANITHGTLDARQIVVGPAGPGIATFATATTRALEHRRAKDIAELLSATAPIVGEQRAIAACRQVLGDSALVMALPYLHTGALLHSTRSAMGSGSGGVRQQLDSLRRATAAAAGVNKPPALQQSQRVKPMSILLAASGLLAVAILLDQVGNPGEVWTIIKQADWGWLAVALAASLATNVAYAVALMGTLPMRLPLVATSELQLSMSYSNLVIPVVGGTGFQIRYLQRQGADLPEAVAAGGLLSLAGNVAVQVPVFVLAVFLSPNSVHFGIVPVAGILEVLMIAVFCVGVITAFALGIPRLRKVVLPPLREAATTVWSAFRSRRQVFLMLIGNVFVVLLYGLSLLACVLAFETDLSFWTILALSIGIGSLASLVPIPGGGTAAGAVGLTATLAAIGVKADVAVAASLANQLMITYLPAIPGWFATRHLFQREFL